MPEIRLLSLEQIAKSVQPAEQTSSMWKGIGIALGIAGALFIGAWDATHREPARPITSDDIAAVRTELRAIQADSNRRFETLDSRLSHLEGYMAGREATK